MANFNVPNTQSLKMGNFRGVDYVNSETNVDLSRATEMRNFIHKDKINQKRNGFVQKAFVREDVSGDAIPVNGHWEFKDSYGNAHTIIHAGNKIYKYTYGEDIYSNVQKDITRSCSFVPEYVSEENPLEYWRDRISTKIKNEPSFGVVRGDRLYILCGVYLVYGVWCKEVETFGDLPKYTSEKNEDTTLYYVKSTSEFYRNDVFYQEYLLVTDPYELRMVEDNEDTYVPVVTTGIAIQGSQLEGFQMSADEVNMLSTRRRVKLLGEPANSVIGYQDLYTVASPGSNNFEKYNKVPTYKNDGTIILTDLSSSKNSTYCVNSSNASTIPNILNIVSVEFEIIVGASKCTLKIPIDSSSTTYKKSWNSNNLGDAQAISNMCVKGVSTNKIFELIEYAYISVDYTYQSGRFYVHTCFGAPKLEGQYTVLGKGIKKVTYPLGTATIDTNRPVIVKPLKETLAMDQVFLTSVGDGQMADKDNIWKLNTKTGELQVPVVVESDYDGQMVLEVEYSTTRNPDMADKINGCKFGCMFGYNEAQQLFVSGNPDYPNMDWHTCSRDSTEIEYNLLEYEDLTYFGELSYTSVGSPVNPIIGYLLLEDSTMAVLKEYNSNEPNMYLRTAYIGDAVDISGSVVSDYYGNTFKKIYYSMASSTIGEGCIAPKACANLAGDKIFLSKNGLFALELNANIKSNERYAKERSRLVNNNLVKEPNLRDAIAIVFENRYYLALGTKIYVADARFKNQLSSEMSDTFSYEFYVWEWQDYENSKITTLFIKNDALWIGTSNGRICAFDDSSNYVDKMYNMLYYGGGSIALKDNQTFTIGAKYNIQENDVIEIVTSEGWNGLGELVDEHSFMSEDIINNKIPSSFEQIVYFIRWAEDKVVRAINSSCLEANKDYLIKNVDIDSLTYELYDCESGEIVDLPTLAKFTLYRPIEKTNVIHKINDTTFKLKNYQDGLSETGEDMAIYKTIIDPKGELGSGSYYLRGAIRKFKNVVAYWYTPVLNMGTSNYLKTTQYITVTPEAIQNGNLEINVLTRKKEKSFMTQGIDTLDLNDLRYTDYSFDISTFERAFSKKLKIKNFNFIQVFFKSDNDKNCIIKEICIDYIITKRSKGVK